MKKLIVLLSLLLSFTALGNSWVEIANEKGITIYSRPSESGIIPFKAKGILNHNLQTVLKALKNDKEKPLWAPKLKSVKIHEKLSENEFVFSEYYKTPWPAYDREFLLHGEILKLSETSYHLKAKSLIEPTLMNDDHVQVDVKYLNVFLRGNSDGTTTIYFEFFGDMKGFMPKWLMNLIQKKWPMRFIQGLDRHLATA